MACQIPFNGIDLNAVDVGKVFDEKRSGVKGLVDAGIKKIPNAFIRSIQDVSKDYEICSDEKLKIPIIDFAELNDLKGRENVIKKMIDASEKWGIFHVVNHGVPNQVQDNLLQGVKSFHEQDVETKAKFYIRDLSSPIAYITNHHIHQSKSAVWRDTFSVKNLIQPDLAPIQIPPVCRDAIVEYMKHINKMTKIVYELISVGLGLKAEYLTEAGCSEGWVIYGHYYPPCPEPELTLGLNKHVDPTFITLLSQDHIGGLQVLHNNKWINVKPIHGSLTIVVGGVLQMITNDKLKAPWHRASVSKVGPRISATVFITDKVTSKRNFAPIKELSTDENPSKYRQFTYGDAAQKAYDHLPSTPLMSYYKVHLDELGNVM